MIFAYEQIHRLNMNSKGALVLLLCALASANPWPKGLSPWDKPKFRKPSNIIGGYEVTPHSHPYAVFINGWGECEGTLISDRWVLTIAQCLNDAHEAYITMGAHNIEQEEPSWKYMMSREFFIHENFHPVEFLNDIALIYLPEAVEVSEFIAPAELPSYDIEAGTAAVITGWGQIDISDPWSYSDVLRGGDITVSDSNDCFEYYGQRYPHTLCVMPKDTGSAPFCNGDFGAAVYKDGAVHGLGSFISGAGCDDNGNVYTKVFDFNDWIKEKTGL